MRYGGGMWGVIECGVWRWGVGVVMMAVRGGKEAWEKRVLKYEPS